MRPLTSETNTLPRFTAKIRELLPEVRIDAGSVFGIVDSAGYGDELSSAAYLRHSHSANGWWMPWPILEVLPRDRHLLCWNGKKMVFPVVRLVDLSTDKTGGACRYYRLDRWLESAFSEWLFPDAEAVAASTIFARLKQRLNSSSEAERIGELDCCKVIGRLVRYAVAGEDAMSRFDGISQLTSGLRWPKSMPQIMVDLSRELRDDDDSFEAMDSDLGDEASDIVELFNEGLSQFRSDLASRWTSDLVKTLSVGAKSNSAKPRGTVPKAVEESSKKYRISPAERGIDPYDTHESDYIRVQSRLALNASVLDDGTLHVDHNCSQLSVSVSQIPFSGFNDPRRLLLAAKAQPRAIKLVESEPPRVISRSHATELDPSGVNLRVGYLAWAGWNHEDAWVISESARDKLNCVVEWKQKVLVPVATDYRIEVPVGKFLNTPQKFLRITQNDAFLDLSKQEIFETEGREFGSAAWRRYLKDPTEEVDLSANHMKDEGTISKIVEYDFFNEKHRITDRGSQEPTERPLEIGAMPWLEFRNRYRAVLYFTISRTHQLIVGDKLCNRHGHKGIVGKILPDSQMPTWRGEPLEALVDPISVINRGNWGQIYETIAGGASLFGTQVSDAEFDADSFIARIRESNVKDIDDLGQSTVTVPRSANWSPRSKKDALTERKVKAIAGLQFVMRQEPIAAKSLSGSSLELKARKARRGFLSQIAFWAHGQPNEATSKVEFSSPRVKALQQCLWLAGIWLGIDGNQVVVKRMDLSGDPSQYAFELFAEDFPNNKNLEGKLRKQEPDRLYFVKLPSQVTMEKTDKNTPWKKVSWLPVVAIDGQTAAENLFIENVEDNPAAWSSQKSILKELFEAMNKCFKQTGRKANRQECEKDKRKAIKKLVAAAIKLAVGTGSNKKNSLMERLMLGERRERSGRAIIAPAGLPLEPTDESNPLFSSMLPGEAGEPTRDRGLASDASQMLGIDEISVPPNLHAILKREDASQSNHPVIWLKRDPVLHRYGMLAVSPVKGNDDPVIRLPASILAPLAGDYDGDSATVFKIANEERCFAQKAAPYQLVLHDQLKEPVFQLGKQYRYGLYLLRENPDLLSEFQNRLIDEQAPAWNPNEIEPYFDWCHQVGKRERVNGRWWALIEEFALRALAEDPGMGLRLTRSPAEILELPVIKCGAAKRDLYEQHDYARAILDGDVHGLMSQPEHDLISRIMAAAEGEKKKFGNEIRHFLCNPDEITADDVRIMQTIAETLTQSVLSVKSPADQPATHSQYKRRYRSKWITSNKKAKTKTNDDDCILKLDELLSNVPSLSPRLEKLNEHQPCTEKKDFMAWIRDPSSLLERLHPKENVEQWLTLTCPMSDLRCSIFTRGDPTFD